MENRINILILVAWAGIAAIGSIFLIKQIGANKYHEVQFNCGLLIGGWHPDVPINVQEKCRELRQKK